jgi:DNA polymerase III subunit beta
MRDQEIGDVIKVRGVPHTLTAKERDIYGDSGYRFTLTAPDGSTWRAKGWRVMHNSGLTPVEPAPVADQASAPATCDHVIGAPGCDLVTCDGVPPSDASADVDRVTIDADARPVETGPETLGRAIMVNLVGRLSHGDHVATASAPTWSSSGAYNHPAGTVRDFSRYALTVDGYDIVVTYYESAGHSTGRLSYYAVSVDGFICDQGSAIKAAQTVDHVAGAIGYAVIRHLELITHPDSLSWVADYSPNDVPAGAMLTPRRIDAVQVGDVIRSFSADGHATVTGPVKITPSGEALVPVERDGYARTMCQPRGRTVAIITVPDQAPALVEPAPTVDQASAVPTVEPAPVAAPAPVEHKAPAKRTAPVPAPAPGAAFTIDRDSLADALAYLVKITTGKRTAPILRGMLITADASGVRLQTFDHDQLRTVRLVGATDVTPGRVLVPCEIVATVVREGLPARTPAGVTIKDTGRDLVLTWQRYRLAVPTLPVEDFPTVDDVAPAPAGTFDVHTLADALDRVGVAAGRASDRVPVLESVHMVPVGDALTLTTCDRYRAATDQVAWSPVEGADALPVANITARTLAEFVKVAAREAGTAGGRVAYGVRVADTVDRFASFTAGAYSLAVRVNDGDFPDLGSVRPAAYLASATVDTRALVAAVKRVTTGAPKSTDPSKAPRVTLTFTAGDVTVSSPTGTETVPCTFTGHDGFKIMFTAPHLVAGLATVGRTAVILLTTSHGKTMIRPADGGDAPAYGYLMPANKITDSEDVPAGAGIETEETTMPTKRTPATPAPVADQAPAPAKPAKRARKATPAPAPVAPVVEPTPAPAPDAETVERVAHAGYVAYRDAKAAHVAGDAFAARAAYADALNHISDGERMAPAHLVAGQMPWSVIRQHIEADAAELMASGHLVAPAPAPAALPAPAPAALPAPAPVGRVIITHGPTGTLMVGEYPYPLRFKVSALLNAKRGGLGWTWGTAAAPGGAWVLDGSAGQPADSGKIRAAVDSMATLNVAATVAVDGYDADAAPAAPVPSVEPVAVPAGIVYDLISRATWSIQTVKPRGGKSHAASVLTLPAGRLDRPVYMAVKAVMDTLGGVWQRTVKGFSFAASEPVWGTNPVRYTPSGEQKVAAWLASNAPTGAPVEPVEPVAAVPPAPAPAPALKVRTWLVEATNPAPASTPAPVVEPAAPAPVEPAALTVADMPAAPALTPADADALDQAESAARAALDAPAPVAPADPFTYTLAAYSVTGVSYGDSRRVVRQALAVAGVRGAHVPAVPGNRRAFRVELPAGAVVDAAAVAAIVAGAVVVEPTPAPVA